MINIQKNVILAPYTTFKIGGPARFFTEVITEEELKEALGYAIKNKLKFFILGGGSNILVSDKGFDGLIIKFKNDECKIDGELIECGAGAPLLKVVRLATDNALTGLEWAAGIPGTIGGAVRGNAGAFGNNMHNSVEKIKVFFIEDDKILIKNFTVEDCEFEYRNSLFKKNNNLIIFSAILKLKKGNRETIQNETKEIIDKRNQMHPQGVASAGSFFINPRVDDLKLLDAFEKDSGKRFSDNTIPAGWLIQEAGLTGQKIGKATVSEKHSNFILNTGKAKAEDVIILMNVIKERVRIKVGVQLVSEVSFLGF